MSSTVLHFIGSLDRGGAETVALDLCENIPRETVQQVFLCLSGRRGVLADDFEAAGALVFTSSIRNPIRFAFNLHQLLLRIRPDSVISHVSLASGPLLGIARIYRVPSRIARMHSIGDGRSEGAGRRAYRSIAKVLLLGNATLISGVSYPCLEFARSGYRFLRSKRAAIYKVHPNGVDISRFRPNAEKHQSTRKQVLYVGRAAPEKNRKLLVPIFDKLSSVEETDWDIIGPGGYADLGEVPASNFHLLGARSDVQDYMRNADVLILTSTREGLPGVVLEALASGLPVVMAALPGMDDLARDLEGLHLVEDQADISAWASAVQEALHTPLEKRGLIRAQFLLSRYTLSVSVAEWTQILSCKRP